MNEEEAKRASENASQAAQAQAQAQQNAQSQSQADEKTNAEKQKQRIDQSLAEDIRKSEEAEKAGINSNANEISNTNQQEQLSARSQYDQNNGQVLSHNNDQTPFVEQNGESYNSNNPEVTNSNGLFNEQSNTPNQFDNNYNGPDPFDQYGGDVPPTYEPTDEELNAMEQNYGFNNNPPQDFGQTSQEYTQEYTQDDNQNQDVINDINNTNQPYLQNQNNQRFVNGNGKKGRAYAEEKNAQLSKQYSKQCRQTE